MAHTLAPNRARDSESSPPPHPTSRARSPCRGLWGEREGAGGDADGDNDGFLLPSPRDVVVRSSVSTMYETLVGFMAMRGLRSASHHVEARASKWATSLAETEEEAEVGAFRGETAVEVDEKGRRPGRLQLWFTSAHVLVPPATADHGRQQHDDRGARRLSIRGSMLVPLRMMCCTTILGVVARRVVARRMVVVGLYLLLLLLLLLAS